MRSGNFDCATIPNVLVDTGSYGLRILASPEGATGTAVTSLGLTQVRASNNLPLLECVTFLDHSYVWGPVQRADVTIAGETAGNLPIQIIGDPQFLEDVPGNCGDGNPAHNENSFQTLGANGILGIGLFVEDCGIGCAPPNPPSRTLLCLLCRRRGKLRGATKWKSKQCDERAGSRPGSKPGSLFCQGQQRHHHPVAGGSLRRRSQRHRLSGFRHWDAIQQRAWQRHRALGSHHRRRLRLR